ncbi:hypothetical protein ABPG74_005094 [Tetrahymena malaccensis]
MSSLPSLIMEPYDSPILQPQKLPNKQQQYFSNNPKTLQSNCFMQPSKMKLPSYQPSLQTPNTKTQTENKPINKSEVSQLAKKFSLSRHTQSKSQSRQNCMFTNFNLKNAIKQRDLSSELKQESPCIKTKNKRSFVQKLILNNKSHRQNNFLNQNMNETLKFQKQNNSQKVVSQSITSLSRIQSPSLIYDSPSNFKIDQNVTIRDQSKNYKNIQKIIDNNTFNQIENPIDIVMLNEAKNSNVIPKKLGILNYIQGCDSNCQFRNDLNILDISNKNVSEKYAQMLSKVLSHSQLEQIQIVKLKNCNLTPQSFGVISVSLPQKIGEINLESNNLGSQELSFCINPLLCILTYPRLRILNLENNKINDLGFYQIYPALIESNITILNISKNNLTDSCCEGISGLLKNSQLIELYLHWNNISSQGGLAIAQGLEQNNSLQVLDLSYNGLGNPQNLNSCLSIVKSCSSDSSQMKHLDLSYNNIPLQESKEISIYLKDNYSLFGMHYNGNEGDWFYDSRGFMIQENESQESTVLNNRQHERINGLQQATRKQKEINKVQDVCWICDGWQEITFEVFCQQSSSFCNKPVFLHLDFENYRPHYMDIDPTNPNRFFVKRMCPPNKKILFFFTDPLKEILYYSLDHQTTSFTSTQPCNIRNNQKTSNPQEYKNLHNRNSVNLSPIKNFQLEYFDSTLISYEEPFVVNFIVTDKGQSLFSSHQQPAIECKPRKLETFFQISNQQKKWSVEQSIFSTFTRDSKELISKCFEFDWENSKINTILNSYTSTPEEKVEVKQLIKNYYNTIRIFYKYHSSLGMIGDIPAISQSQFIALANKMKISDGKLYKIADIDYNFIAALSNTVKQQNYRNPDKAVIRFQFLELIVRIACDKYMRNGNCKKVQKTINKFFSKKTVSQTFEEIEDPQQWRDQRYWKEACEIVINKYLVTIEEIWQKWADCRKGEKRILKSQKTMNIYEFNDIVRHFKLIDESFTEKDVSATFNLSIMTQIDEINNDKFLNMGFIEFVEGLARIAEKKCMEPLGIKFDVLKKEEIQEISLEYKLERFLEYLKDFTSIKNDKKVKQTTYNNLQQELKDQKPLIPSLNLVYQTNKAFNLCQCSTLSFIDMNSKDSFGYSDDELPQDHKIEN